MKSTYTAGKTILASSVFLGMAFGTAHAEICYKLNPFIDVIRVAQTNFVDEAPNGSHRLVVGNWQGGFSKAVVGSLDVNVPGGGLRLGLHGTLHDGDCLVHSESLSMESPAAHGISAATEEFPVFSTTPALLLASFRAIL